MILNIGSDHQRWYTERIDKAFVPVITILIQLILNVSDSSSEWYIFYQINIRSEIIIIKTIRSLINTQ